MLKDLVIVSTCTAAGLLFPAGISKLRQPETARSAALSAGIRNRKELIVGFGAIELVAALTWIISGLTVAAIGVGLVYAVNAVVAIRIFTVVGRGADCGCFGANRSPLGWPHIAFNLVSVLTATGSAVLADGTGPLRQLVGSGDFLEGVLVAVALVGATAFAYYGLTIGAQLFADLKTMETKTT